MTRCNSEQNILLTIFLFMFTIVRREKTLLLMHGRKNPVHNHSCYNCAQKGWAASANKQHTLTYSIEEQIHFKLSIQKKYVCKHSNVMASLRFRHSLTSISCHSVILTPIVISATVYNYSEYALHSVISTPTVTSATVYKYSIMLYIALATCKQN